MREEIVEPSERLVQNREIRWSRDSSRSHRAPCFSGAALGMGALVFMLITVNIN